MERTDILATYAHAEPEIGRSAELLEVRIEGDGLSLYTGEGTVRKSRTYTRAIGAIAIVAGVAIFPWYSNWGLALIAFGLIALVVAPRFIRAVKLLDVDTANNTVTVVQNAAGAGTVLHAERIAGIRGAYETKGWDGFSVVYAVEDGGSETAILMLLGTDERLAAIACKTLGLLLNRPAVYAGASGVESTCFTPVQSR